MRFAGPRTAIIVVGVAAVLAVPAAMVLGHQPAKFTTTTRPSAAESGRDFDDHQAQIAGRLARATPSPTLGAEPAGAPAGANPLVPTQAAPPAPGPAAVPTFSHIFVIVMENHEYGSVIGRPEAPYVNSLAATYGLATNYYAASHPSLPNYFALTAGSTFGIASDCTTCYVSATNIADQVESNGRSWKAYMEDMPTACFTHDCPVATGDAWLHNVVPRIIGSAAFRNWGVLFITWDEGSSNASCCGDAWGGHVATLVISPRSISGFRSNTAENHYSLLRTIEDGFQLGHLGAAAWSSSVNGFPSERSTLRETAAAIGPGSACGRGTTNTTTD